MKIISKSEKRVDIKELQITEVLTELDTGSVIDLNTILKEKYVTGDIVKVSITKVDKSEETE